LFRQHRLRHLALIRGGYGHARAAIFQDRSDLRRAQRRAERRRDGPQTDGAEKRHDPLRTFAHDQRDPVAALQSQILEVPTTPRAQIIEIAESKPPVITDNGGPFSAFLRVNRQIINNAARNLLGHDATP